MTRRALFVGARGPGHRFVVAALAHSIFKRTCPVDVGLLAARYGGGGHPGASSVPLPPESADALLGEIIAALKKT